MTIRRELALVAVRPPNLDRMVWIPSTQKDELIVSRMRIEPGDLLTKGIRLHRNGKHHRLVFAMLEFLFHSQEVYTKMDDLRRALTCCTSFVHEYPGLDGQIHREPRSWSYAEMDEQDFSQLHDELVEVVLNLMWPNQPAPQLEHSQRVRWLNGCVEQYAFENKLMGFL